MVWYNRFMETIRILQLNVWTGRMKGALRRFFEKNQFDVVCLQEAVWCDNREMLESFAVSVDQIKEISGLRYESRAANWGIKAFGTEVLQGNVILSRFEIVEEDIGTVYGEYQVAESRLELDEHCYKAQLVRLSNGLSVMNYHGYWLRDPMGNETTVEVMRKVADMIKGVDGSVVMCGDLNVTHESPAMWELDFMTDLTYEYGIDNTLVGLNFGGKVACDHILVNDHVEVTDFVVMDEAVSDHKAVVAEVKI